MTPENNAESYSNKSNKPNYTSISTEKKVNFRHNRKKQEHKKDQTATVVVGYSMVKDMYGWELSDNSENVVVKHFSGSTTEDMMTYIHPLKRNPDRFIIHVRTNDLRSNQDHETIAGNIVEVANNSKTDTNKVLIPCIVSRRDNLNGKGCQVNTFLKKFVCQTNFSM